MSNNDLDRDRGISARLTGIFFVQCAFLIGQMFMNSTMRDHARKLDAIEVTISQSQCQMSERICQDFTRCCERPNDEK